MFSPHYFFLSLCWKPIGFFVISSSTLKFNQSSFNVVELMLFEILGQIWLLQNIGLWDVWNYKLFDWLAHTFLYKVSKKSVKELMSPKLFNLENKVQNWNPLHFSFVQNCLNKFLNNRYIIGNKLTWSNLKL